MLLNFIRKAHLPLLVKIILCTGIPFIVVVCLIFAVNFKQYADSSFDNLLADAERLSDTIRFGTWSAMMADSKKEVQATIQNVSRLQGVVDVRIYNKRGEIKFSGDPEELGKVLALESRECGACHTRNPPPARLEGQEKLSISEDSDGKRLLSILSPIGNAPDCHTAGCHAHREDEKVLGLLTITLSLGPVDSDVWQFILKNVAYLFGAILLLMGLVYAVLFKLVHLPIRNMMAGIGKISAQGGGTLETLNQNDELGELAKAIQQVGEKVRAKHAELNEQREIYWRLFEAAPCIITVQNKDFELIRYNKYFADHFPVRKGIHCYEAYKNQPVKCEPCPVEKTFEQGVSHFSEESGFYKDGSRAHWMVSASPMFDREGKVAAAVSVSLDITARKKLEEDLKKSEKKYNAVFNNIPRALFLLNKETLTILDCNRSATSLYGYTKGEMIGKNFIEFFAEADRQEHQNLIKNLQSINRVKHAGKGEKPFYVNISLTDSDYQVAPKVILAMVIDVTERIEAEQQVIQANKMATLGEMATGVAHELNQPLSVIQMISNLFARKLDVGALPDRETLSDVSSKLRSNVERASKIINHMREFGRKSALEVSSVQINDVILRALDFFGQQLRLRNIEVVLELEHAVPSINADPNRLEQVFINLLTNARDAIEEKFLKKPLSQEDKRITIRTHFNRRYVFAEVCDSGAGIPKELTHKIFEPFFTTKTVGKGTGLGLSISYDIISDYGGTIHALSKEGEGACFDIRFPRAAGV